MYLTEKFKEFFTKVNNTFFYRLLVFFILAVSIPTIGISILSIKYGSENVIKQELKINQKILYETKNLFEQKIKDIESLVIQLASYKQLSDILRTKEIEWLIKDGAVLVNTARAPIINELGLITELKRGRFKAGLDVFWQEPLPADHELRRLPNVILTPHRIGGALQQRPEMTQMVIDDIKRFLKGEKPKYQITREMYDIIA